MPLLRISIIFIISVDKLSNNGNCSAPGGGGGGGEDYNSEI